MNQRVVCVTGSSSGLGKYSAQFLSENQWTVVLNSRKKDERLDEFTEFLRQRGTRVFSIPMDVSTPTGAKALIKAIEGLTGRLDALVHAVGPFIRDRKLFVNHSLEEIEQLVNGNFLSSIWLTHAALPVMRKHEWGRVVYFGFGRVGEAPAWPDRSIYAATKTGLASLTKTLAVEEAKYGITVNMVCPGDIVNERKEMEINQVRELIDIETPRGRPGCGEDVARVVAFLLQEDSDFVTGNMIHVTGGLDVIHPVSKMKK